MEGLIAALMWARRASAVLYAAVTTRDRAARDGGLPQGLRP